MSQLTEVPVISDFDVSQAEKTGRNSFALDINTEVCVCKDSDKGEDSNLRKQKRVDDSNFVASRGIGVDLNAEDVSSTASQETSNSSKIHKNFKSTESCDCGSSLGPLCEKDPMRRWEEMKKNGFLSSYGGITRPKLRLRKCKKDGMKKRMELAKREQVDRFAKFTAPSGLLNDLNPGIINHVRNRNQVYSIIEALVGSENFGNENIGNEQLAQMKSGTTEGSNRMDLVNMNDSAIHRASCCQEDGPLGASSGIRQTEVCSTPINKFSHSIVEGIRGGHSELGMVERVYGKSCDSQSIPVCLPQHEIMKQGGTPEHLAISDDRLELKSSSSAQAFENASPSSNEDSATFASTVSAAARVASQWLNFVHQDIQGRLSALQRSKTRLRTVITSELPSLISKEFPGNQEKTSCPATVDPHIERWSKLFDQMYESLTEEEKELRSSLNEVKEMQLQCDRGLQLVNTPENDSRSRIPDGSNPELAVMAAAASIFSTANSVL